jgi:hypothetical protein
VSQLGASGFLGYAEVLRSSLEQSRSGCRSHWPNCIGIMDAANTAVLACIGSILSRPAREYDIEKVRDKLERATIHSAVVQGIHAIEHCIANGIYAHAAALVRMEIEAVGALVEIRQGRRRDGKTPNIFPLRHLGHTYGQLSGIAHLSTHDLLTHVVNEQIGNVDHRLNQDFARHLFGSHLCALAAFALDLADFRPASPEQGLCTNEEGYLSAVFGILTELKFIVVKDE